MNRFYKASPNPPRLRVAFLMVWFGILPVFVLIWVLTLSLATGITAQASEGEQALPGSFLDKRSQKVKLVFSEKPTWICMQKEKFLLKSNPANLSLCKPFDDIQGVEIWIVDFHITKESRFGFYKESGERIPTKVYLDGIEEGDWVGGILRGKSAQAYIELMASPSGQPNSKKRYKLYPVESVENWTLTTARDG